MTADHKFWALKHDRHQCEKLERKIRKGQFMPFAEKAKLCA